MARSIFPPLAVAAVSHDAGVREVLTRALSRMPGVVFTGACSSAAPAVEQAWVSHRDGHRPPWNVLMLDWALPGAVAGACARRLQSLLRTPRIVALVTGNDPAETLAAVRAGADAVLLRSLTAAELTAQLEPILELGVNLGASLAGVLLDLAEPTTNSRALPLPLRQQQMKLLRAAARGLSLPEIGQALGASTAAVADEIRQIHGLLRIAAPSTTPAPYFESAPAFRAEASR